MIFRRVSRLFFCFNRYLTRVFDVRDFQIVVFALGIAKLALPWKSFLDNSGAFFYRFLMPWEPCFSFLGLENRLGNEAFDSVTKIVGVFGLAKDIKA